MAMSVDLSIPILYWDLLRVEVKVRSIHLVKSPEKVFRGAINVVSTRIIWEVVAKRRPTKLLSEKVDFVEEQNNASPHEPPRIYYRVKENQAFHHAVLKSISNTETASKHN